MISLIVCLFLLSGSQCYGAPGRARSSRIIGGSPAAEGEFPFVVSILTDGNFLCGGTIINENWVMTAAGCVDRYNLGVVTVRAGSTNDDTGVVVEVNETVIHEAYDGIESTDDIAVLKLSQPLSFSSTIQAVSLPSPGQQTAVDTTATAVGLENTKSSAGSDLFKVDVPVWFDEDCLTLSYDYFEQFVPNVMICAGGDGKGKCGDRGFPLLANGQQVGISSWGEQPCATIATPGVYTEVSAYVDWINGKAF